MKHITTLPLLFQAIIQLNENLYFPIIKDMSILNRANKKYIIKYEQTNTVATSGQ